MRYFRWALEIIAFSLIIALLSQHAHAQTPSTSPMIAGCPSPLPAVSWPASTCQYNFYPLTDTTHAIAAISKTTPAYQHTYGAYGATALLVACPAGAIVSAATCLDSTGKDVSVIVAKSAIPALTIVPIVPPPPTGPDYTMITGYLIEQSYDAGKTWDSFNTQIIYPMQNIAHCFRVTANRKDGNGPPMISCPLPK